MKDNRCNQHINLSHFRQEDKMKRLNNIHKDKSI